MRLGTRDSALALAQAEAVAELIGDCVLVPIATADGTAAENDKSRWVSALERALAAGDIDLAVHSAKDVPGELAEGLALLGAPTRAPVEDVLCGAGSLQGLAPGARVGTSSVRRMAQLRAARPDLVVVPVRGNVDTRLRKLGTAAEGLDAIVLARAGLSRLGLEEEIGAPLDLERFLPAPGQGTIVLEGHAGGSAAARAAEGVTDGDTFACLRAERALAGALGASCLTPLGALALPTGDGRMQLSAWVGLPDGSAWAADRLAGDPAQPELLGERVAARMRSAGAADLLERAEEMAGVAEA
jgi:hydroxymethylbilane synthase